MTQTNLLYVYGKEYGRFSENTIKERVSVDLVEKAMLVSNEEEFEDFMESDEVEGLEWAVSVMLGEMAQSSYMEQKDKIQEGWNTNKAFTVELEEYSFGVATTPQQAKIVWLSLDDDGDEEGW
jgi:hypothetical protein